MKARYLMAFSFLGLGALMLGSACVVDVGAGGGACFDDGSDCDIDADCCSGICDSGVCVGGGACFDDGSDCGDDAECCSGICNTVDDICGCSDIDEPCNGDLDCCEGFCASDGFCS